ncbi:MAG: hypothetical protein H7317_10880 [Pseudorhodobacter sp.]|nr:hypothetical protein [Pseudorhodobacter sp.]
MIGRCMGGGIGSIRLLGWPLSDWAVVLLLLVLSVLTVALVAAAIGVIASWLRRPERPGGPPHQNFKGPVQ